MKLPYIQCQICQSMVFEDEDRCTVHTHDKKYLSCMLCAASAEKLGWWLS